MWKKLKWSEEEMETFRELMTNPENFNVVNKMLNESEYNKFRQGLLTGGAAGVLIGSFGISILTFIAFMCNGKSDSRSEKETKK